MYIWAEGLILIPKFASENLVCEGKSKEAKSHKVFFAVIKKINITSTASKVSIFGVIVVRIFPHSE